MSAFDVYIIAKTRLKVNSLKSIKIEVCKNTHTLQKTKKVSYRIIHSCYYEKFADGTVKCIEDELPFEVPRSWEWAKIQHLAQLGMGQTVLTKEMKQRGIPIYSATIEDKPLGYIDEIDNKIRLTKGDLVIPARGNSIGYVTYINCSMASCTQTTIYERFFDKSISLWIYFFYQAFQRTLFKYNGAAIPQITVSKLEKQYIPFPPLAEQKRIVAEIEKYEPLIAEYDKLEQQATKLDDEIYDNLKKSILQYAIQGKLVPQDENDEPASELLKRIRTEKKAQLGKKYVESYIYKGDDNCYYEHINGKNIDITEEITFDLPNGWSWCRIAEISKVLGGKRIPAGRRLSDEDTGHIYIKVSDMKNGTVELEKLQYVPLDIYPSISRYIINKDDVYITVAGTIGRVGTIPSVLDGANLTENADRLVFNHINQKWFVYCLQSKNIQEQVQEATTKVGQPKLAIARIEKFLLPLAPLAEQKRIVEKIDEIFAKL